MLVLRLCGSGVGWVCCNWGCFLAKKFIIGWVLWVSDLLFTPVGFLDRVGWVMDSRVVGDGCFVGGRLVGFVVVGWVVGNCGK